MSEQTPFEESSQQKKPVDAIIIPLSLAKTWYPQLDPSLLTSLSQREGEVLNLMLQGYNCKEISICMGIASKSVANYQQNIYRKFGVHSKAEVLFCVYCINYYPSQL